MARWVFYVCAACGRKRAYVLRSDDGRFVTVRCDACKAQRSMHSYEYRGALIETATLQPGEVPTP